MNLLDGWEERMWVRRFRNGSGTGGALRISTTSPFGVGIKVRRQGTRVKAATCWGRLLEKSTILS